MTRPKIQARVNATLTLKGRGDVTDELRKDIASWLRRQADRVEHARDGTPLFKVHFSAEEISSEEDDPTMEIVPDKIVSESPPISAKDSGSGVVVYSR